jgi:hypothetical protein
MNQHDGAHSTRIVFIQVVRASVQLDKERVELVMKKLRGADQFVIWAAETEERDVQSRPEVRYQRIGFSRLVQREAIRLLAREYL